LLGYFSHFADDVANVRLVGFDGLGQLKLNKRTLQVVLRTFDLEIYIASEIIGEESDAKFKREQANSVEQVVIVGSVQEVAGLGEG